MALFDQNPASGFLSLIHLEKLKSPYSISNIFDAYNDLFILLCLHIQCNSQSL
ncbi:MAG: hypothetical protein IEMM0002_0225 [bacterium]|nr:MAG: hypothetical protein IEMM0002_0225 [bacterium]